MAQNRARLPYTAARLRDGTTAAHVTKRAKKSRAVEWGTRGRGLSLHGSGNGTHCCQSKEEAVREEFNFGHGSMAMITRGKEGTRRTQDERRRSPTKAKPTHAL